ncbi:DUF3325 domain-containing protein [uncultured Paraglaciecola sp.]|uniref:DUF3325 domain-containing protein n=1 Tax=uncultured Paraglaciecola sp. TaxID=1765024 RepID=UPI0030D79041
MITSISIQLCTVLCLSLAMDKHYKPFCGRSLRPKMKILFRVIGWVSLICSLVVLLLTADDVSIRFVDWLASLSLNIFLVALLHGYLSQRFSRMSNLK